MSRKIENYISRFVTDVPYEQACNGMPESWNEDGEVFKLLLEAVGEHRSFVCKDIKVNGEQPFEQTNAIKAAIRDLSGLVKPTSVPILDFSSYRLTVNLVDDIVEPLNTLLDGLKKGLIVLLPLDRLTDVRQSYFVNDLEAKLSGSSKGILFVEQNGKTFCLGKFSSNPNLEKIQALVEKASMPTQREFKRQLIQESKRWFGHFVMRSGVHVRTHYDCYSEILENNWLYGYAAHEATKFIKSVKPVALIGFGLVEVAVTHLTVSLATKHKLQYLIHQKDIPLNLEKLPKGSKVLLVSDVVLTGKSAEKLAKKLETNGIIIVGLLCVLGLSNSTRTLCGESPIKMLAQLDRPFYDPMTECPLCECGYPQTSVNTVDDFRHLPDSINPYDFWESVEETSAFSNDHQIIAGRHYTYYIDIQKLLVIYADSIARQLCNQAKTVLELSLPSTILFPEGKAAEQLAHRVAKHLKEDSGDIYVQSVPRNFLTDIVTANSFMPPDSFNTDTIRGKHVVVVDDGCCSFDTFYAMEQLVKRLNGKLVVYFVILNRAVKGAYDKKKELYKDKLQCYYHWPAAIHQSKTQCPQCV